MLASVPEALSSMASTAQTRHSGCIRYCSVAMTTHHNQGHSDKEEFISAYGFRRVRVHPMPVRNHGSKWQAGIAVEVGS